MGSLDTKIKFQSFFKLTKVQKKKTSPFDP